MLSGHVSCSFALLALAVLLSLGSGASAALLTVSPDQVTSLSGSMEYFRDESSALTLADVLHERGVRRFEKLPGFLNLGYIPDATWSRFTYVTPPHTRIHNSDLWFLRISPAFLDDIRVYVQEGPDATAPASYREYRLGDNVPMAGRAIRDLGMTTPLPAATTPRQVYIRIRSSSSHNFQGEIYPEPAFIAWTAEHSLITGVLLGLFCFVILSNIFSALLLKSGDQALCSLYFFCNLLHITGLHGALFIVWPSQAHRLNDFLVGGGVSLGVTVMSLILRSLFSTRARHPRLHGLLGFIAIEGILSALLVPCGWYGRIAPLTIFCYICLSLLAPYLAFRRYRRQEPAGGLFLTAFTLAMILGLPRMLMVMGVIPSGWIALNTYILAILLQALCLTLALVQQLHISREQLLSVSRQAELKAVSLAAERTRELSERQQDLQAALQERETAYVLQQKFVAMISHEYRTPLAILTGSLHLLERYGDGDDRLASLFVKMARAIERLRYLFEHSLDISRFKNDFPHPIMAPVTMAGLVTALAGDAGKEWPERRFILLPAIPPDAVILADRDLLRVALWNLVGNAVKYSDPHTSIEIFVTVDSSGILLEIRDQGAGIAATERELIFDKFYRGGASAGISGSGIGLWLVRWIIEEHGGIVTLRDHEPQGTVAVVRLRHTSATVENGCSQ